MLLRRIVIFAAIAGSLTLGLAGCNGSFRPGPNTGPTTIPTGTPVPDSAGDVVSAEAIVVPYRQATVNSSVAGRVQVVRVHESQSVSAGEALVQLDPGDLAHAVRSAEAALSSAQAQLAKAKTGARPEEISAAEAVVAIAQAEIKTAENGVEVARSNVAAAQARLVSAQGNLEQVQGGATPEQLNAAEANLALAEAALKQAQAAYDQVAGSAEIGALPQSLKLEQATIEHERAQASYQNLANGATKAEIKVAQGQVREAQAAVQTAEAQVRQAEANVETAKARAQQAEAQLALLKAGARQEDISVAEAAVAQAEVALAEARDGESKATIRAPFAGVVGAVPVEEGEFVSPQAPLVQLGDLSQLRLETRDLSEVDVNRVEVGQPATVVVDALGGRRLQAKVSRIAPAATDYRGDRVYTVTLELEPGEETGLRWGMTAIVDIRVR